jgi:NAD(P) transhydrogenase subunit alpha
MDNKNIETTLTFGVLNEAIGVESRVAITPESAIRLLKAGIQPVIEAGAGLKAGFQDSDYEAIDVKVLSRKDILEKSDIVGYIVPPSPEIISSQSKGSFAVGLFNSLLNKEIVGQFENAGITALDIALLPRKLSKAQSMDLMTSQASVAGYKAVLLAANEFSSFLPMMTTAAGTIKPASILILGAGIAGLQAIGTAKRLGAVVTAYDVRPASKEEVLSLGAKFLDLSAFGGPDLTAGQGEGGYARELTVEERAAQQAAVDKAAAQFDIIITTAQVPGRKPPVLLTKAGVDNLKRGSIIIDVAASSLGGNVEGSDPEMTVLTPNGVKIIGAPNLPSTAAKTASNLLSRNIADIITHFVSDGKLIVYVGDELEVMAISGKKSEKQEVK